MTTLAIIQARATSTRLPNKVLMKLAGVSVLGHVLNRCATAVGVDKVCCAVPEGRVHDEVAVEAERFGAAVYRGEENDVLARFCGAARQFGADTVMRVTSDCPLADPVLCAQVIALRVSANADYACNNMPPSWPHGLDCEVFTADALYRAQAQATEPYQREHVTPWIRTSPGLVRINLPGPGGSAAEQRWTLDFPEDLRFFERLFEKLPPFPAVPTTAAVLEILRAHPEIAAENSHRRDAARTGAGH